jgi:hypothetical protein
MLTASPGQIQPCQPQFKDNKKNTMFTLQSSHGCIDDVRASKASTTTLRAYKTGCLLLARHKAGALTLLASVAENNVPEAANAVSPAAELCSARSTRHPRARPSATRSQISHTRAHHNACDQCHIGCSRLHQTRVFLCFRVMHATDLARPRALHSRLRARQGAPGRKTLREGRKILIGEESSPRRASLQFRSWYRLNRLERLRVF